MRFLFASVLAVSLFCAAPVKAQVTQDMSRVTCAEMLSMAADQKRFFSAWMSGWFNQRFGYITIGLTDFERNIASVTQFCSSNPRTTLMAVLERSPPQQGPITGQVKIDMSLVTCQQYLGADAGRKELLAAWMSGYFRAAQGQSNFDFQRFANNRKAVAAYCKKRGSETLMSAIQKGAR